MNCCEFHRVTHPNVLGEKLDVDYHQKLSIKFQIKDKQNNEFFRVQQAFLRWTNKKSNKEVIYLAEASTDVNAQYKVDVVRKDSPRATTSLFIILQDFTSNANDFRQQSGAYELVLLVGDALLENAFAWKLHDQIQLSFHEDGLVEKSHQNSYQPKKEIIHQFREDEKRPSTTVSLIFSALTVLPLLVLVVLVSEHL